MMSPVVLIISVFCILATSHSFIIPSSYHVKPSTRLFGLGDMLKGAFANDASIPPPKNPGLSKDPIVVEVEFLPSKKIVKAILGQKISDIAKANNVAIRYNCKKGECATCEVNFNGKIVKACQATLPATSTIKKFQIGVPEKAKPSK